MVKYSELKVNLIMSTEEEIHQQLYDAMEKDDINTLKTLLEPPLNVDTIVCF